MLLANIAFGQFSTEIAFPGVSVTQPVAIVTPPGETDRVFVVEKTGRIRVITNLSEPAIGVFLDLSGVVSTAGEQGLLGLAFHPNYAENGYFYVFYTTQPDARYDRLSRFSVSAEDPNVADSNSEVVIINQVYEATNHNGGDLHFGPDGCLYVSLGDEGLANDSLNNSQRIDKDYFSAMLRIDVDFRPDSLEPNPHPSVSPGTYAVPADNPFVGATSFNEEPVDPENVRTEFWAVGLRNPWRFSFDPADGRIYCGDVGQGAREEIDIIERGGNYGWAFREGFLAGPKPQPPGAQPIDPIWDYPRNQGASITGGLVHRGANLPELYGAYLFCDYVSGRFWALWENPGESPSVVELLVDSGITAFGVDPRNGDVLLADLAENQIKRLVGPATAFTLTASPSSVPPGATLTVSWTAPEGRPSNDWVGLYAAGDPDDGAFLWRTYTDGTSSGSADISAPESSGEYEFRYFLEDGYTLAARSNTVTVQADGYALTASPSSVSLGEDPTVSWTAPEGRPSSDWVGLYAAGEPDDGAFLWWTYTDGTTSGSATISALDSGEYEFRYFLEDGYTLAALSNTVTVEAKSYT
ncbi:MAG: PQQ-dependent sugar dehydrogenase, partial [Verrucomicrobiota bacterium]|nr:PQQ-dependent sugar dehydrogenase [Verrucomicrobiota bacterium]